MISHTGDLPLTARTSGKERRKCERGLLAEKPRDVVMEQS